MTNKPANSNSSKRRIDAAHLKTVPVVPAPPPKESVLAAVAGRAPASAKKVGAQTPAVSGHATDDIQYQLELHARELGTQLQTQQRDLDRRQADFNARLARIENELRSSRIQLRERELELAERETEFHSRWHILQEQANDVASAERALNAEYQEDRLQENYNHDQIKDSLERWKVRLQELDKSELLLQAQLADVSNERDRLAAERAQFDAERKAARTDVATERALMKQRIEKQLLKSQQQTEQIERRRQSVQQLHNDVTRMYREALEVQICNEELRGRLCEQTSPTQVTAEVAKVRRRLTDQYHLANESLAGQRKEIAELMERLESQHASLGTDRENLQQWLSRRQTEIERQAAKLVAREQELDKELSSIRIREDHWDQQRREYEQVIRELRRQVVMSGGTPMTQHNG